MKFLAGELIAMCELGSTFSLPTIKQSYNIPSANAHRFLFLRMTIIDLELRGLLSST